MFGLDLAVALVIAVGLAGIVVPGMPGSALIGTAVLVWALVRADLTGWATFGVVAAVLGCGTVIKYLIPGRRLARHGIGTRTLLAGAALGVIGFFLIPVVGFVLGFVLGVYLAELVRLSPSQAVPATVTALKAVGLGIVIELGAGVLAAGVWAITAVAA